VATGLKLLKEVPLVKLEPRKEGLQREGLVDTEKLMEEERERERSVAYCWERKLRKWSFERENYAQVRLQKLSMKEPFDNCKSF